MQRGGYKSGAAAGGRGQACRRAGRPAAAAARGGSRGRGGPGCGSRWGACTGCCGAGATLRGWARERPCTWRRCWSTWRPSCWSWRATRRATTARCASCPATCSWPCATTRSWASCWAASPSRRAASCPTSPPPSCRSRPPPPPPPRSCPTSRPRRSTDPAPSRLCAPSPPVLLPANPSPWCSLPLERCSRPPGIEGTPWITGESAPDPSPHPCRGSRLLRGSAFTPCPTRLTKRFMKALSAMQRSTVSRSCKTDTSSRISWSLALTSTAKAP